MDSFDQLSAWDDQELKEHLTWYRRVAGNRRPAKYLIARRIAVDMAASNLWDELDRATEVFLERWNAVRQGADLGPAAAPNLLDLTVALSQQMLKRCNFCRWHCHVDRSSQNNKLGACQLAESTRVSTFFHHRGEELIFRGRQGSGTIFFTSCNMRCSFCQNGDISTDKDNGLEVSAAQLAAMARQLREEGCHNINWVGGDPIIHLHTIVEAVSLLCRTPDAADQRRAMRVKSDRFVPYEMNSEGSLFQGELNVPMLWNSNFFMSEPAMKILRVLMDVWLPDFKFGPGKCAVKLSRTPWYWETVTQNLKTIDSWGESYAIRHLIMPNHVECCTRSVLDWIQQNIPQAPVNLMDQYHPDNYCDPTSHKYKDKYRELSRRPTSDEILSALRHADSLGIRFETVTYERHLRRR